MGIGHLATATINGFPLGLVHFPIALGLAGAGCVTGLASRMRIAGSFVLALALGATVNILLIVLVVPLLGWAAVIAFAPFLTLASILNALIAGLVFTGTRGRLSI